MEYTKTKLELEGTHESNKNYIKLYFRMNVPMLTHLSKSNDDIKGM